MSSPLNIRKEGGLTENLTEHLIQELNCDTVFTVPVFGGISVNESTVITWIIMAALVLASILLTRNLKVQNPGKVQLLLESGIKWAYDFFDDIFGKQNRGYTPYLITVLLYLAASNTFVGLLGFKPPTKDLNITIGLALISLFLIESSGIRRKGIKGYIKHFKEPVAIITPINILEIAIRPLSLCMRLFGNVLGAFVIMELIKLIVPLIIPIPFSLFFDLFDGLLQAYIFVFLTAIFMNNEMEE